MSRKVISDEQKQSTIAILNSIREDANNNFADKLNFMEGTAGLWPEDKVIRTGSVGLDLAIGIGGWPRGRIFEIYGQESSGKTTLCLHTIIEAQRAGIPVIYIDAENALDPTYMARLGVDNELLVIQQPSSLQKAMNLMVHVMENSEQPVLFVVDSVPALAPQEVLDAGAEQQTRALAARYWSAQLPKIAGFASRTGSTIMLINQMREGMDMYTPASTPGGKAIKFYASVRVEIKRKIEGKNQDGGSDGQFCNLKVIKNKVGSPFKAASYWLPAGEPIVWANDVIGRATEHIDPLTDELVIREDEQYVPATKKTARKAAVKAAWVKKKGWYSYQLDQESADAIAYDDPETQWRAKEVISVYQYGKFCDVMNQWPSLIEVIERKVLETLGVPEDDTQFDAEVDDPTNPEALESDGDHDGDNDNDNEDEDREEDDNDSEEDAA